MTDENKAKALRILEAFRTCDEATLRELIAPDSYEHYGPKSGPIGPDSAIEAARWLADALSEQRWDLGNVVAEGDVVVIQATHVGRHTGTMLGIPPTGREVRTDQVHISRFADGKVVEHWGVRDDAGLLRQLQAEPQTAQTGSAR